MRIPVAIKVLREATSQKANKEILDVRTLLNSYFCTFIMSSASPRQPVTTVLCV